MEEPFNNASLALVGILAGQTPSGEGSQWLDDIYFTSKGGNIVDAITLIQQWGAAQMASAELIEDSSEKAQKIQAVKEKRREIVNRALGLPWGENSLISQAAAAEVEGILNESTSRKRSLISEAELRKVIRHHLLNEDLSGGDKSDIKRMITKEIESVTNRRQIEKVFQTQFEKELRKALGVSFFGTPGKINKFVIDAINDEVARILGDNATRQMMADITKEVLVRLYKELSFHQEPVIRRLKV